MHAAPLSALVSIAALCALPAAAHPVAQDREQGVVSVNECPLPAYHGQASRVEDRRGHAADRCQAGEVAPPVEERRVRNAGDNRWAPGMTLTRLANVDGGLHREEEDRSGWDDHEYAYRERGVHPDFGDGRWFGVYREAHERVWARGEHWIEACGCGPERPRATDE